jgi:hypothetical protein
MSEQVPRVMIGMDPHKRSVTIEEGDAPDSTNGSRTASRQSSQTCSWRAAFIPPTSGYSAALG